MDFSNIAELRNGIKDIANVIDEETSDAIADATKRQFNSFLKAGFSRKEAIKLTSSKIFSFDKN